MQLTAPFQHRKPILKSKGGWLAIAGALGLAGTAAYVAYAARRAEEKFPPSGEFIDVDGVRLHYLMKGEGYPTILLLHGNGSMASDFEGSGLFGALAAHHKVIAIDRPGFGYSERPRGKKWDAIEQARLIAAATQRLAIGKMLVVGHSSGTQCAMALALEAPHLVSQLVLMSGYYYPTSRIEAAIQGMNGLPIIGNALCYTASALSARFMLDKFTKRVFAPQQVPQRFLDHAPRDLMLRPSQMRANGEESLMMNKDAARLSERYADIPHPITLLAGDEDGALSTADQSAKLHEALPNSKLKVIERAGHMLHYAAPLVVIAAIEEAAKNGKGSTNH